MMQRHAVVVLAVMVFSGLCGVKSGALPGRWLEGGSWRDPSPSRLSLRVDMGGSSLDLHLDPTSDPLQPRLPVYRAYSDHEGRTDVFPSEARTDFQTYQDREKEAAFVLTTRTDEKGNTTQVLEGMVRSDGKVYVLKTATSTGSTDSAQGRSLSGDLDLQFDVQDLEFNATNSATDYIVLESVGDKEAGASQHGRQKRQVDQDVFIDIVAFVDFEVYSAWYLRSTELTTTGKRQDAIDNIAQYYAFVFNGMDMMYKSLTTLSYTIHIRLVGLIIAETAVDSPITENLKVDVVDKERDEVNAYTALDDIRAMLAASNTIPLHDHFMYFTGHDLRSDTSTGVAGLATLSATCRTDGAQSSISEDRGNYHCMFIGAHELGHSLSARHDGTDNTCLNTDRYIMSTGDVPASETNRLNAWDFSVCSADDFHAYISATVATTAGRQCMYEKLEVNSTIPDVTGMMPGQVDDAEAQCQRIYGANSSSASCAFATTNICEYLWCYDPDDGLCHGTQAARGTDCGVDMWCIEGQCISKTLTNECASSPCQNGGTCNDMVGYFTCTCPSGFAGDWCEDVAATTDECASNPCLNGGTCTDGDNTYTCTCPSGFSGLRCELACTWSAQADTAGAQTPERYRLGALVMSLAECQGLCETDPSCVAVDHGFGVCNGYSAMPATSSSAGTVFSVKSCTPDNECASGPCLNGGVCTDLATGFSCTCTAGFSGSFCQTNDNECSSNPCYNGGTCTDGVNTYTCTCPPNFVGSRCETLVSVCVSNPCLNGGTCNNQGSFYTCSCAPGFTGVNCQDTLNVCASNPCLNGGTCNNYGSYYTCTCAAGFSGVNCQDATPTNACDSGPCQNGGICNNFGSYFTCTCNYGYSGSQCQDYNDCASNPCVNGGSCYDFGDHYICNCPNGFSGSRCQYRESVCGSNPCQNGGTCNDLGTYFTCTCPPGYSGSRCESYLNGCASYPCLNGGTCTNGVNSYTCTCPAGYTGYRCENFGAKQCPYNPCQNGGTCDYSNYNYNCYCAPGFSGTYCEQSVNPCANNPCVNGGYCAVVNGGYTCSCPAGFSGSRCESTAVQCPYNPCTNGGTCDYSGNTYTCICPLGFSGTYCENSANYCASSPCLNGGTCTSDSNGFSCLCSNGYVGIRCENTMVACPYNPCTNGGTCDYTGYNYNCYCRPGFSGTYCEVSQ